MCSLGGPGMMLSLRCEHLSSPSMSTCFCCLVHVSPRRPGLYSMHQKWVSGLAEVPPTSGSCICLSEICGLSRVLPTLGSYWKSHGPTQALGVVQSVPEGLFIFSC